MSNRKLAERLRLIVGREPHHGYIFEQSRIDILKIADELDAMGSTAKTDWMDEARIIAAQCWCTPETSGIEMNVALAEVFAQRLAAWINTAAQNQRNADYWHGRAENAALIRALKNADPQEKE